MAESVADTEASIGERVLGDRFSRWLDSRIPRTRHITLSQRNIFIFPTRVGFVFGGLILLMLIGAINYQASLVYGLAFLLGSLFLVTILYTFRNLSGLSLEIVAERPAYVGETLPFRVRLERPRGSPREGIRLGWPLADEPSPLRWAALGDQESDEVELYVRANRRGFQRPGRLLVETFFPLGLLRAWTWVDLDAKALVYPKPIFGPYPERVTGDRQEGTLIDPIGSEDFADLKPYQQGDPVKHILWRSYARSDELAVKNYASYSEPRLYFDLDAMPGDLEERISRLAGLALTATRSEREFGARIGPQEFAPDVGNSHLNGVLRSLALYGQPVPADGDRP
ncbi:MAG: DUF58 domain-containing protein [Pseudomonadota bacterium]